MRSVVIILFSLLAVSAWAQAPIYRQFFTTNPAPIVDVVAGSNAAVQASTPAANIRRFTVNAALFGTNVIGSVAESTHATNADNATYVTTATLTNQIDTTSVIGDAVYGGTMLSTNGYVSGPLTVATLPGSPSNGQMVWCSDVVTTRGTGDYVYYDGASWRNREHVVATTDIRTFILNCWAAALNASTPLSTVWFSKEPQTTASGLYGYAHTGTGYGGATAAFSADTAYGTEFSLSIGTGTAGGYMANYPYSSVNVSGEFIGVTGNYRVGNLSDGTDIYWVTVGMSSSATTNYPTSGAFFLYDANNQNGHGISGTATNNWIATTCQGSSYTYTDTGFAVSTTTGNNRLGIIMTSTNCVFYTNGVAAATHTSNLPTSAQNIDSQRIVRVSGTTARLLYETSPGIHIRQAANRTY